MGYTPPMPQRERTRPMTSTRLALRAIALALPLLAAGLARAETTAWAENDGGRMRLVALPPDAEGKVRGAIEIEPKPGWITYWREPGGSGVPPQVSVSGGPELARLRYPPPKILTLGALTDIGYDAPVSLPFELAGAGKPARIDLFIGLCEKICIPFQASFDLALTPGAAPPEEGARVAAAEATIAENQREEFHVTGIDISREKIVLGLHLPAAGEPVEVIATGPAGYVFTARNTASAADASVTVPLTGYPRDSDPAHETWQFVMRAGNRTMETQIDTED